MHFDEIWKVGVSGAPPTALTSALCKHIGTYLEFFFSSIAVYSDLSYES